MTVATTGGSGGVVGLEDLRASDLRVPRLKIAHKDGAFVDPLTGVQHTKLTLVVLGVIRGRVMWNPEVLDGDVPQCKSPDDEHGFPTIDEELPGRLRFPWADSVFNKADQEPDPEGRIVLSCAKCNFTKWGENKKPPRCTEVATLPVLYTDDEDPGPDSEWNVALWGAQKTALRPVLNYVSAFAARKVPTFTAMVEVTFKVNTRGSVVYSVPILKQLGATPSEDYEGFASQYIMIRDFQRRFPGGGVIEEELPATSDNTNTPAPTAPAAATHAPAVPSVTVTPEPPTPAPAAPASVATPAAVPTPAPTPAPASAPVPESTGEDDDELPF